VRAMCSGGVYGAKLLFAMLFEVSHYPLPIVAAHGGFGVAMQRR